MSRQDAERRFRLFERDHAETLVALASHAALPVVLNPDFVHLLRVNYFLDPPDTLPYAAEAELLLSPLCTEVDQGLYAIDPDLRDVLLRHLIEKQGPGRLHDVARLLWEYGQRGTPWSDRPGLPEAQQLSALNFIDPARAQDWLTRAEAEAGPGAEADERWFVAMREDLESRAAAVKEAQERADLASGLTPALAALCEALASRYPTAADALAISTRVGIIPASVPPGTTPSAALWREIVTAVAAFNGIPALLQAAIPGESDDSIDPAIIEYWVGVRPALRIEHGRVVAPPPEWAVLDERQEQIGRSLRTVCLITARPGPGFHRSAIGLLAGQSVVLTTRRAARSLLDSLEPGRTGIGNVWLAFADRHATLPQVPTDALLSGERAAGLVRALVTRAEYMAATEIAALQIVVHPADAVAMPAPLQATAPPADLAGRKVYVLGYPSMGNFPAGTSRMFGGVPEALRLQPGEITGVDDVGDVILHDCLATVENNGSPLVDLVTGQALGLQRTSRYEPGPRGLTACTASVLSPDVRGLVRMLDEEIPGLIWATDTAEDALAPVPVADGSAGGAARADEGEQSDFPLSAPDIDLLQRELTRIYHSEDRATLFLQKIRYPRERIPAWRTAVDFWSQVFENIERGVMRMPYRRIIDEARYLYGRNSALNQLQHRYQEAGVTQERGADLPLSQADVRALLRLFARIYYSEERAVSFLQMIRYPRELIPGWQTATGFWAQIFEDIDYGAVEMPYRLMITEALDMYPGNLALHDLQSRYEETTAPEGPAGEAVPDAPAADSVCNLVVQTDSAAERDAVEAWLDNQGLAPQRTGTSPTSVSFWLNQADPGAVQAVLRTRPDLRWALVPPGPSEGLRRFISVKGPDVPTLLFDVPASTPLGDLVAQLMEQYAEGFPDEPATSASVIRISTQPFRGTFPDVVGEIRIILQPAARGFTGQERVGERAPEQPSVWSAIQVEASPVEESDRETEQPSARSAIKFPASPFEGGESLAGRIRVGGLHALLLSAERVASDPELRAHIEDQSGLYKFYLVQLTIITSQEPATPRLESVAVTLSLTSTPDTPAPVAISMVPMEASHEVRSGLGDARAISIAVVAGAIALVVPPLMPVSGLLAAAATAPRGLLQAAGLLTERPRWEFRRQSGADLAGAYQLALIVRAAAGSTHVMVNGVVTARTGGGIIRRFRSELRNPLQFSLTLEPNPPA